jgi:hypothetical protein
MGRRPVLRPFRFVGLQRSRHTLDHRSAFANYDCLTTSVKSGVRTLKATAAESFGGKPYSIVAHFLGDAVGFCLAADGEPVVQIFTMSTPFVGGPAASLLTLVFFIKPSSPTSIPRG